MTDHDQRFKVVLKEFLAEFVRAFFPEWLGRFDFARVVWLDQEVFTDPPAGERRVLDLVARIPVLPSADGPRENEPREKLVLFHIEVESADAVQAFRKRAYDYYHHLSEKYDIDVLPVAVYLDVGLGGRGRDVYERKVWDRTPLRFEYDYVGLPGLDGEAYLGGDNLLAVAWSALMRFDRGRRVAAADAAIGRILASGESRWRKVLLVDCVQTYAPLDDEQRVELASLLADPTQEDYPVIKTWTEEWLEQGELRGQRKLLRSQLQQRFGPLPPAAAGRLESWPSERLEQLASELLTAASLRELGLED